MDILSELGLAPVLNGVGPATRLGGLPLPDEVWDAVRMATRSNVRMDELQIACGRRIARLLGVPGAYVTSGATAALTLAAAAVMTRAQPALIDQLPHVESMPFEVVIQRAHRDPYDHAVTSVGARLVEIGFPATTHPDELERVLSERTAAVLFRPGRPGNLLSLRQTAEVAHRHDVPVIVDGALYVPPVDRLTAFFDDGADLVAVSGGKGFRGPQASGLLCGRPDLLDAVALHHQDMDERQTTWPSLPRAGRPSRGATPPRHGIGRGMKVGREQLFGLLAAIERYLRDPAADERCGIAELDLVESGLITEPRLVVTRVDDDALAVPTLHIDVSGADRGVDEIVRRLAAGSPRAFVGEELAWRNVLTVNPMALAQGHGTALATAIRDAVADSPPSSPTAHE